jgi:hypothetical protein
MRTVPIERHGTLIILTDERFTAENPEHVKLAGRLHAILDDAGLLGPTP